MSVLAIALPAMAAETTVGGVNVRSGPSTSYGRVGDRIAQGSTCTPKFKAYGSTVSGSTSTLWYYVDLGTMLIILDVLVVALLVMPLLQDTFILLASAQLL